MAWARRLNKPRAIATGGDPQEPAPRGDASPQLLRLRESHAPHAPHDRRKTEER
jgi:hypothetical protein